MLHRASNLVKECQTLNKYQLNWWFYTIFNTESNNYFYHFTCINWHPKFFTGSVSAYQRHKNISSTRPLKEERLKEPVLINKKNQKVILDDQSPDRIDSSIV